VNPADKSYFPLMWCECGEHIVRENLMFDDTVCIDCAEGGVLRKRPELIESSKEASKGAGLPAPIDAGLPLERERGTNRKTLAGQLILNI